MFTQGARREPRRDSDSRDADARGDGDRIGRRLLRARPRRARTCGAPTRRSCSAPGRPTRAISSSRRSSRSRRSPARRRSTRATASSPRTPPSRAPARRPAIVFIGPPADAIDAMGSKTKARELMKKAGVPIVPGHNRPGQDRRRRQEDHRQGDRLPDRGQGRGRRRRQGLPRRRVRGRAREGVRGRRARGREVLLRLHRLHRALPARPAPRRGPGAGGLARQRPAPVRARLLRAAPPPEADRGEPGARRRPRAARADRQDRDRGRPGRRLPLGRHDRGAARRTASTSSSR